MKELEFPFDGRQIMRCRRAIKKQLQYVRRDLGYIDSFLNRLN